MGAGDGMFMPRPLPASSSSAAGSMSTVYHLVQRRAAAGRGEAHNVRALRSRIGFCGFLIIVVV